MALKSDLYYYIIGIWLNFEWHSISVLAVLYFTTTSAISVLITLLLQNYSTFICITITLYNTPCKNSNGNEDERVHALTTWAGIIYPKNTFNRWSSRDMRTKSGRKHKLSVTCSLAGIQ